MNLTGMWSFLARVGLFGFVILSLISCSNTMEGFGKDLQSVGASMDPKSTQPAQPNANNSLSNGKDVVVTPIK